MRVKAVTWHAVVLLFTVACARKLKLGKLHKKHPHIPRTHRLQKHVIIPGAGGTTVIQGAQYGAPAPAAPSTPAQCCPQAAPSCCAPPQPASPPCCLTLQPYGSHNIPVNAPSKVVLHINVLPGTPTAAPTTAASAGTTPTGSTPGELGASTPTPTTGTGGSLTTGTPTTGTGTGPTPTTGTDLTPTTGTASTGTPPQMRDRHGKGRRNPAHDFGKQAPGFGHQALNFRHQALVETNRLRSVHAIRPKSGRLAHFHDVPNKGQAHAHALRLDAALNNVAQRYAQQLANSRKPMHSDPRSRLGQGENIAVECSHRDKPLNGKVAADMWYNEVKDYKWNHPGYNPHTAHFTQLVWQGSKRVGFGRAKFRNGKGQQCYVLVARYAPRGNIKGRFINNVVKGMYAGQHPVITTG